MDHVEAVTVKQDQRYFASSTTESIKLLHVFCLNYLLTYFLYRLLGVCELNVCIYIFLIYFIFSSNRIDQKMQFKCDALIQQNLSSYKLVSDNHQSAATQAAVNKPSARPSSQVRNHRCTSLSTRYFDLTRKWLINYHIDLIRDGAYTLCY